MFKIGDKVVIVNYGGDNYSANRHIYPNGYIGVIVELGPLYPYRVLMENANPNYTRYDADGFEETEYDARLWWCQDNELISAENV